MNIYSTFIVAKIDKSWQNYIMACFPLMQDKQSHTFQMKTS